MYIGNDCKSALLPRTPEQNNNSKNTPAYAQPSPEKYGFMLSPLVLSDKVNSKIGSMQLQVNSAQFIKKCFVSFCITGKKLTKSKFAICVTYKGKGSYAAEIPIELKNDTLYKYAISKEGESYIIKGHMFYNIVDDNEEIYMCEESCFKESFEVI